jgi:tetratricopeptide (TPR) repeat protein
MASLSLKAGLPSEAVRLIEQGYIAKVLGTGGEAANHAKLRQQAMSRLAEDEKILGSLEKSAKDGNDWAQMADVLSSQGLWLRANEAYSRALEVGQLRREAELRLHYGLSLFKAKQLESARTLWLSVKGDATAVELSTLWRLWAQ